MVKKFTFVIILIVTSLITAQYKVTTGNLLRINFLSSGIDFNDTLWNWRSTLIEKEAKSERCIGGFELNSSEYLLVANSKFNPSIEYYWFYLINASKNVKWFLYERPNYLCANERYLYSKPKLLPINNGIWILFGIDRTALFFQNDSLYEGKTNNNLKLIHIAGSLEKNHIAVLEGDPRRLFLYEIDLNNSPEIKIVRPITILNEPQYYFQLPRVFHHLSDSLYIFKNEYDNIINLVTYSNNQFIYIKKLKPEDDRITMPDFTPKFFIRNKYFYFENRILYKETFNRNTLEYENKTIVLDLTGLTYNYDPDSNYYAYYRNDSVFVYSINKEEVIFRQSITPIKNFIPGIMSPPYIYYHQVKTITGVSTQEELPLEFTLSQNYPNPFNPSTTIEFTIPNVESRHASTLQKVMLKVYDLLGREISTLVDEEKLPGKYTVQFSPGPTLPSGVYFYQCKIGNLTDMKKMILLK